MIRKSVSPNDVSIIINAIEPYKFAAPYLYNNLKTYGVSNNNVDSWNIDELDNSIFALRYFNCLHIFSEKNIEDKWIKDFADGYLGFIPGVIMHSRLSTNDRYNILSDKYDLDIEKILVKKNKNHEYLRINDVSIANRMDIKLIAQLLYGDKLYMDIYSDVSEIETQLLERFDAGYGKCFVIKEDNGNILASSSISADNSDFSIVGSIIVSPYYRNKGLGLDVSSFAWESVLDNGKPVIDLVADDNNASLNMHSKYGFRLAGTIYKYRMKR